jgi:hypothetical protein
MSVAVEHERFILTATKLRNYKFIAICDKRKRRLFFNPSGGRS